MAAGLPPRARPVARATLNVSQQPAGQRWLCWRLVSKRKFSNPSEGGIQGRLTNFERQFHRWCCEPALNALEQIDFKRLANVVACQVFERGGNQQLIGT